MIANFPVLAKAAGLDDFDQFSKRFTGAFLDVGELCGDGGFDGSHDDSPDSLYDLKESAFR